MLVGIHVEGNDHLVVRTLLGKLLGCEEAAIEVDRLDLPGMGWQAVLEFVPKALKRFYAKCCSFAVLGVDDDGNPAAEGGAEDPAHPRHWRHGEAPAPGCRRCELESAASRARPSLDWIPGKPGASWPIVICVPVEAMESWLLAARAIVEPGRGSLHAENEARIGQKFAFYGRPAATREDVEGIALPLLRSLTAEHLTHLRRHSHSFDDFAGQVIGHARRVTTAPPCWS